MKGYLPRLTLALSLTTAVAVPAQAFDLFGLFSKKENTLDAMLTHIPADTPVFAGGHADPRMSDFYDNWMMPTSEADMQELRDALDEGDADQPALKLLSWWLDDYSGHLADGYAGLMAHYGLGDDSAAVFYLDGAMPVIRFALADTDAFNAVVDDAISETGLEPSLPTIEDVPVKLWRLSDAGNDIAVDLAIAVHQDVATVTLFNSKDDDARRAGRLGLTDLDDSLAKAGTWKQLGETYGFEDTTRMYLDFATLTKSFMRPDSTRLGRDLKALDPSTFEEIEQDLGDVCRDEFIGLAEGAPRLVAGSTDSEASKALLSQSLRLVWEIDNADVSAELQKLPGSLPSYSLDASDKLMAFGLGLDVNQLAPVATALWTQFTTADFECQKLVDLQTQAKTTNPAMLGMASGMAQGVKGVAAALYSLEADPTSPAGLTGSALVSISADNPQAIAGLITSSVPGMASLSIPTDGTAVQVPAPLPTPPLYAAIKGKHLVVYTGEPAKAAADALAQEPLNTDGVTALALNYERFGQAALEAVEAMPDASALNQFAPTGNCSDAYASLLQLAQLPLTLTYSDDYTDRGWEGRVGYSIRANKPDLGIAAGTYRTETLDYDCSWYPSGQETLNDDRTGRYSEQDDAGQCDVYRIDYRWEQNGAQLAQTVSREQSRDSCDADWTDVDAEQYECTVLGKTDSGFYCLYSFDGEASLMRYTRQ